MQKHYLSFLFALLPTAILLGCHSDTLPTLSLAQSHYIIAPGATTLIAVQVNSTSSGTTPALNIRFNSPSLMAAGILQSASANLSCQNTPAGQSCNISLPISSSAPSSDQSYAFNISANNAGSVSGTLTLQALAQVDTQNTYSQDNGTEALTLFNPSGSSASYVINMPDTTQFSVSTSTLTGQASHSLASTQYCTVSKNGDHYQAQVPAGQHCDIILQASANNPPSVNHYALSISPANSSVSYPVTVNISNYLYVGGEFTTDCQFQNQACTSTQTYNHLAAWNGSNWVSLASGVDDNINTLMTEPKSGDLYVGGWFMNSTDATPQALNHIAFINKQGIHALGAGLNNAVNSIDFIPHSGVVLGGNFTADSANHQGLNYLAQYTDGTWHNLDANTLLTGPVKAVAYDSKDESILVGANSPISDDNNLFGNSVAYPLYRYLDNQLSIFGYANNRVDRFLVGAQGDFIGGNFSQYAPALGASAIPIPFIAKIEDNTLSPLGQLPFEKTPGDFSRTVKSIVQVGNTVYVSGYFIQAASSPALPYGNMNFVASCNLSTQICQSLGTPAADSYWVYQLLADTAGNVYAVTRDDTSYDVGPDYVFKYSPGSGWSQVGSNGFNHLVFTEALGSTLSISVGS